MYNNSKSETKFITHGVPQGSILGPLFFIVFMNLVFKKLVIQRILLLMFKHNIGIVPKPIASLFRKKDEIHGYNTRHCSSLHPGKSEATYRTFSCHTILIWNYLSKLICTNFTLACFKKGL